METAGPPAFNPFTKVKGDSEKFRVIHRTVSPDGRYAIARGFARAQIIWGDFVEKTDLMTDEPKEGSHTYTVRGEQDVRNYVVDLSKVIDKSTATLIKKSRDPIGIWIDVDQVNNDGSIVMRVTGVSRGEEHLWDLFSR